MSPRGVTRVAFVLCGSTRRSRGGGVTVSLIVWFIDGSSLVVLLACGLSSLGSSYIKKKGHLYSLRGSDDFFAVSLTGPFRFLILSFRILVSEPRVAVDFGIMAPFSCSVTAMRRADRLGAIAYVFGFNLD